jgi:hypothetical protein
MAEAKAVLVEIPVPPGVKVDVNGEHSERSGGTLQVWSVTRGTPSGRAAGKDPPAGDPWKQVKDLAKAIDDVTRGG